MKLQILVPSLLLLCCLLDTAYSKVHYCVKGRGNQENCKQEVHLLTSHVDLLRSAFTHPYSDVGLCNTTASGLQTELLGLSLSSDVTQFAGFKADVGRNMYCNVLCKKTFTNDDRQLKSLKDVLYMDGVINLLVDQVPVYYCVETENGRSCTHVPVGGYIDPDKKEVGFSSLSGKNIVTGINEKPSLDTYLIVNHYDIEFYMHNIGDSGHKEIAWVELSPDTYQHDVDDQGNVLCTNRRKLMHLSFEKDLTVYVTYSVNFQDTNKSWKESKTASYFLTLDEIRITAGTMMAVFFTVIMIAVVLALCYRFQKHIQNEENVVRNCVFYFCKQRGKKLAAKDYKALLGVQDIADHLIKIPQSSCIFIFLGIGLHLICTYLTTLFLFLLSFSPNVALKSYQMLEILFIVSNTCALPCGFASTVFWLYLHPRSSWLFQSLFAAVSTAVLSCCPSFLQYYSVQTNAMQSLMNIQVVWSGVAMPILFTVGSVLGVLLQRKLSIKSELIEQADYNQPEPELSKCKILKNILMNILLGGVSLAAMLVLFKCTWEDFWQRNLHTTFVFDTIGMLLWLLSSGLMQIVCTFNRLIRYSPDYKWWNHCFHSSISIMLYFLAYAAWYFFTSLTYHDTESILYYVMYSVLVSIVLSAMAFVMAFLCSWIFAGTIYQAVRCARKKSDEV